MKSLEEQMALKKFALRIENDKTITMPLTKEDLRKITFIEQSLTYAEAMQSLTFSNLFLCAPEGDFILDQLNFFNQANKENTEMRGCASALFDGQTITRSTRQGKTFIEGKTLSICVGSTGSKWSSILLHLHENLTSDGFHPRFLFYALEPAATIDVLIHLTIEFFLGQEKDLNRSHASLAHIYVIRGLIGDRLQTFTTDATEFIQPYLSCLNSNESYADESPRSTTSYEEVVERRGAELIVRIVSNIQYMKICLQIIRLIDQVDFYTIDESFVNQASAIITSNLGPSKPFSMGHNALPTNLQPKLMITKETCEEAVKIFFKIFIPQHFTIMNYRYHNDTIETSSELGLQTRILKVKYQIFHKTVLSGNNGILKNIDKDLLDHLLDHLVRRGILKKGNYLQSERSIKYESYIKYLPCALTEQQQLSVQLKKHDISYEEYQQLCQESEILPPSTRVTPYGKLELEKQNMVFGDTHDVQRQQSSAPQDSGTQSERNQNITNKDYSSLNVHVIQQQSNELELLANQNSLSSNLVREIESLQSPNSNREKISNEQFLNSSSMSSTSLSSTSQTITFDPVAALANPSSIPKHILDKCKQFLLSSSPVITRTCWNRRFGGNANVCYQATQLLLTADLLMEGQLIVCSTKSSTNWIKKLPTDPTNTTTTLSFQQNKLNIFGITWNQYVSSFQQLEFGHSRSSGLISQAAATILGSKPYLDIGFILDETIIFEKKEKKTFVAHRQDQTEPANLSLTSVQDIHLTSFSEQENSNAIHTDSTASIVTQSLPISDTSNILIQSTLFSSAPIETSFNNPTSNAPSTPKRTRRELSPMKTRSKTQRLDKCNEQ
ncbi:unnamed protein product [Rotaria sp. Silwood2]|nr:unnamed protein product [Rotaria sp. Silwood2]